MPPTIHEKMSVGERIRLYRVYRGMTQEACAGLVGKSLSWWKKVESGVRRVEKLADLVLVAQVLRVPDLTDLTGRLEYSLALDRDHGDLEVITELRAAMLCAAGHTAAGDRLVRAGPFGERLAAARQTFHDDRMFVTAAGRQLAALLVDVTLARRSTREARLRRELAGLLSDAYVLICQVLRHASEHELAWTAIDRAVTLAYEADDPVRVGWATWQSSGCLKDQGEAELGLGVCLDALALLEPLMNDLGTGTRGADLLSLYGDLRLQTALMAGHCSDEGTALRHMDAGELAYRRIPDGYRNPVTRYGQDGSVWAAVWVPVALGKSRTAISNAERIDITTVPSRPLHALWLVNVARAHAARKDDVATMYVLNAAEEANPETVAHSSHVREIVREMLRRDRKTISQDLRAFANRIGVLN